MNVVGDLREVDNLTGPDSVDQWSQPLRVQGGIGEHAVVRWRDRSKELQKGGIGSNRPPLVVQDLDGHRVVVDDSRKGG